MTICSRSTDNEYPPICYHRVWQYNWQFKARGEQKHIRAKMISMEWAKMDNLIGLIWSLLIDQIKLLIAKIRHYKTLKGFVSWSVSLSSFVFIEFLKNRNISYYNRKDSVLICSLSYSEPTLSFHYFFQQKPRWYHVLIFIISVSYSRFAAVEQVNRWILMRNKEPSLSIHAKWCNTCPHAVSGNELTLYSMTKYWNTVCKCYHFEAVKGRWLEKRPNDNHSDNDKVNLNVWGGQSREGDVIWAIKMLGVFFI